MTAEALAIYAGDPFPAIGTQTKKDTAPKREEEQCTSVQYRQSDQGAGSEYTQLKFSNTHQCIYVFAEGS